jgi:hypothetical protein
VTDQEDHVYIENEDFGKVWEVSDFPFLLSKFPKLNKRIKVDMVPIVESNITLFAHLYVFKSQRRKELSTKFDTPSKVVASTPKPRSVNQPVTTANFMFGALLGEGAYARVCFIFASGVFIIIMGRFPGGSLFFERYHQGFCS